MTKEKTITKKTSLIQHAWGIIILNAALLLTNFISIGLNHPRLTVTAENYATLIPIRHTINIFCIIILLAALILSIKQSINHEKEDELARLHRYKAGYISLYIFLLAVIVVIYAVKNFEPAFTGDFLDNIDVAYMLFAFSQCVENIVFIYLEKHNLE